MSIPDRYDVDLIQELKGANHLLHKLVWKAKGKGKIENISCKFNRSMYTRHRLHLNEAEKLKLSQIVLSVVYKELKVPNKRINHIALCDEADLESCVEEKLKSLSEETHTRPSDKC